MVQESPRFNLGNISADWCNHTVSGTSIGHWARAGLYYYCGGHRLFTRIPELSVGLCAMVRLHAPLMLRGERLGTSLTVTQGNLRGNSRRDSRGDLRGNLRGDSRGDSRGHSRGDSREDLKGDLRGNLKGD
ncbi:hypothetical protein F7725_017519 [Dissostichus mawsoni]|uniref:Uncharacterized protein n=1 Tax=Dissostichus mawsoni TaxID=36200 RepID=A0A7J5Z596_DISMA|nr:hypothetical protein F7725_017519 [Dissostichus mawsoni]